MLEELDLIDVSAIEELENIKEEQKSLQERLERMTERQSKVSGDVYERVHKDYTARYETLEEKASPLKDRARAAYAVLRDLLSRLESDMSKASLEVEETKLRHELGEFDDKAFATRRQECDERLQLCESLFQRASDLKENFVGAFHSEEELETGAPAPPPPESSPPPTEIEPDDSDTEELQLDDAEDISGDDEDSGSEVVDSEEVSGDDFEDGDTSALAQAPDLELEEDSDHNYETQDRSGELIGKKSTVVTPQPRLIEIVEEGEGRAHVLRIPITTVGRLNLNHICVPDGTVSRNHAKIVVSEAEITVFDLASENGVFVNKNQITEHILVSGDIVQFGAADQLFEFRVD